jgi:hypothetical protein
MLEKSAGFNNALQFRTMKNTFLPGKKYAPQINFYSGWVLV